MSRGNHAGHWERHAKNKQLQKQRYRDAVDAHIGYFGPSSKPRPHRKQKIIPLDEVARRLKHDRGISTAAPEVSVPRACDYLVLTSDEIVGANPADSVYPALHHHGN